MRFFRHSVLVLAALALVSCAKKKQPSPEFAQAQQIWTELVQVHALEAHADPRAEQVLALLASVDPNSLDAQAAAELAARIRSARAEAKASAERQAALIEAAAKLPPMPEGFAAVEPAEPEPPPAEPEPVAEPAEETQPSEGMEAAVFKQKFDRCFEYKNAFGTPTGQEGDVWGLKDLSICRELHPTFTTRSVLLMDGRVAAIRSNQELTPVKYKLVDGALVPSDE